MKDNITEEIEYHRKMANFSYNNNNVGENDIKFYARWS